MEAYKERFIDFMVECEVLTFGNFVTKSGRQTPYFINTGKYRTGGQLKQLAEFYADAIEAQGFEFDLLFGPAYKGIPLVVATAMVFAERGRDVAFCFNRKEFKDHGEGGNLVGQIPNDGDRVLILEDVTTAGTSIRETVPLLRSAAKISLAGLIVSVDRKERGQGAPAVSLAALTPPESALIEVGKEFGMKTAAIADVDEIMNHLRGRTLGGKVVLEEPFYQDMVRYRKRYGA